MTRAVHIEDDVLIMGHESVGKRWIEAGKLIASSSAALVDCPRCGNAKLLVTDTAASDDPTLVERHMRCPRCGAYNAVRLHVTG